MFFYKDNSFFLPGEFSGHEGIREYVTNEERKESIRTDWGWGYFYIEGDKIIFQYTDLDQTGLFGHVIEVRKGCSTSDK
ncbi:MAG: hypothetical protein WDO15_26835 [Bacteroidota bacterium]